jgi:hypothetical protein
MKEITKQERLISLEHEATKLFYTWYNNGISNSDNEHEEKRDQFIQMWMQNILVLFKEGNRDGCSIYYHLPKKILDPLQRACIDEVVIRGNETFKKFYIRIEEFYVSYVNHFTTMAADEGIQEELYECADALIKIIPKEVETDELLNTLSSHKFKWKGTPAQLAFIINLLQDRGYIEGLTSSGERNAKILLNHFEIEDHNPTPESLGKCFQALKNDTLPINREDASKFLKIPHRNDLKR